MTTKGRAWICLQTTCESEWSSCWVRGKKDGVRGCRSREVSSGVLPLSSSSPDLALPLALRSCVLARRDYDQNPELDTYSQADIDDENEYGQMSARERREAEREMEKRDRGATGGQSTKPKSKARTPASSPCSP